MEVREKHCKALKSKCKKCDRVGHYTEHCFMGKKIPGKKAKGSVVSVEKTETAVTDVAASSAVSTVPATGPAATLNSVEPVSEYRFNPERYASYELENSSWWSVEAVKPIQSRRIWATMEAQTAGPVLGHYLFNCSVCPHILEFVTSV